MIGRFCEPVCKAGFASSAVACAFTPAETAPRIEVFTKSRRENVILSDPPKPGRISRGCGDFHTGGSASSSFVGGHSFRVRMEKGFSLILIWSYVSSYPPAGVHTS